MKRIRIEANRDLCYHADPAAPFAAEMLLRAMDLYAQADAIVHRLAVLAHTERVR